MNHTIEVSDEELQVVREALSSWLSNLYDYELDDGEGNTVERGEGPQYRRCEALLDRLPVPSKK